MNEFNLIKQILVALVSRTETQLVYSTSYGAYQQVDVNRETPSPNRYTKPHWGGGKR